MRKKIAIFASGSGTNAEAIIQHFTKSEVADVALVLSNKPKAYVLERAAKYNVDTFVFNRPTFYETDEVIKVLQAHQIDFIVLAGFLWLIPDYLIQSFSQKIVNIHPALLPKYGGRGMYGMRVHEAVVENGEKESGITIHYVNEHYDEGQVIFQAKCTVDTTDTAEDVAQKIHKLEYAHFPEVIEDCIKSLK